MPASQRKRDGARARAPRTRVVALLAVAMLVFAGAGVELIPVRSVGALPLPPASPSSPSITPVVVRSPSTVSLFGDSLARQASAAFVAELGRRVDRPPDVHTYPATALCDYRNAIFVNLVQQRPQVLVLEFSGNTGTNCMRGPAGAFRVIGSADWRSQYLEDLRAVLKVARLTGTRVVWVTAPPVAPAKFASDYTRTLAAAIRKLTPANANLRVVDTGAALTTNGAFAQSLPCRADERVGCHGRRITVRAIDGLHFDCQGATDPFGACVGYSAGSRRFGEAMAAAAATWGTG